MLNIIRNTALIFKKNKEFIYLITIQPVIIFLLMSFLLPYSTAHNVAVINEDGGAQSVVIESAVQNMDGIKIQKADSDNVTEKLLSSNIELAVVITPGEEENAPKVEMISLGNSEIEDAVTLCVEQAGRESITTVNPARKTGMTISNSLGFMIFKTLTSGNLLAALIVQERKSKMRDRILLSGLKTRTYLGGMAVVYLLFMMLGSVIYYLAGLLFRFDFGMRNSIGFLWMLFTANVLSVAIYLFASTLVKTEDSLWGMATFILLPMSLFSGVLFPYEFMPKGMQVIGAFMPQRWIAHGIEAIQESGSIAKGLPDMCLVLLLSAVLYVLAVLRTESGMRRQP
jgi:ABC-2 type transport system permease protein